MIFFLGSSDLCPVEGIIKEVICHTSFDRFHLLISGSRYFTEFYKSYVLVTAPLLLLPVVFSEGSSEEMRCAYVVLLMVRFFVFRIATCSSDQTTNPETTNSDFVSRK